MRERTLCSILLPIFLLGMPRCCCPLRAFQHLQVVITSHARSMSQTFWGAEQAKDHEEGGTTLASTEMQENLTRLETENAR